MLLLIWSALPAGLAAHSVVYAIGPHFNWAAWFVGFSLGIWAGFACNSIWFQAGGIPVLCIVGAIIGPCAGLYLFPPATDDEW
jgi:hypothetical protein